MSDQSTRGAFDFEAMAKGLKQRDETARGHFCEYFSRRLYRHFRSKWLNETDAEDLVQDCLMHIEKTIENYTPGNFEAWVIAVANRKWLDLLRKRKREQELNVDLQHQAMREQQRHQAESLFDPLEVAESDLSETEKAEVVAAVEEALASLPSAHRDAFVLHHFHGHNYEQIGAQLGIASNTAKMRFWRARQRLQELLQDDPRLRPLLAHYHRSRTQGGSKDVPKQQHNTPCATK